MQATTKRNVYDCLFIPHTKELIVYNELVFSHLRSDSENVVVLVASVSGIVFGLSVVEAGSER